MHDARRGLPRRASVFLERRRRRFDITASGTTLLRALHRNRAVYLPPVLCIVFRIPLSPPAPVPVWVRPMRPLKLRAQRPLRVHNCDIRIPVAGDGCG
jgi:hypothetical protein